ncbi:MAG: SdpI family protein [Minisyncoccota bacterium]
MKNPIQYSLKTEIWPLIIFLATISLSLWAYPQLPDQVISHWDFNGEANGWSSREFHSIFFPILLAFIYTLFRVLPKFDPNSERYTEFSGTYLNIRNLILSLLFVIFIAATLANLGYAINIGVIVSSAVGILMIALGNYFKKIKRNWFIGIRTPWTISSENVWTKTHLLGGRLFVIWGLCLILAPWLTPAISFLILFGGIITIISWIFIYSYILFKKETEQK